MTTPIEHYRVIMDPAATLDSLAQAFPTEWAEVQDITKQLVKDAHAEAVSHRLLQARAALDQWNQKLKSSAKPQTLLAQALPQIAKARLTLLAIESVYRRALAAPEQGRRGALDHFIAQTLFFNRQRQRRSPSRFLFRCLWPLVKGKAQVAAAIQNLGIYCVFSQDFGRVLKPMLQGRACLEIGAGDGSLTLLLEQLGVPVHATDDYSWSKRIRYPTWVEQLPADAALHKYQPEVVLCSWPPPGNSFEKHIFTAQSVRLYIAIISKHRYAAGNWQSYEEQRAFRWEADSQLSRLLLPPEWDHEVLVFRRDGSG